jgi:hypothetical protein
MKTVCFVLPQSVLELVLFIDSLLFISPNLANTIT